MNKWINCDDYSTKIGTVGYLVEVWNSNTGGTSFHLYERPLHTNRSNEPRLQGWCGEDNNRSKTARGAWKVVRQNKAGDRAQIVKLAGDDLAAFLETDGYPELIPVALAA